MPIITTKDGVDIFYKDWGEGQPIVFSHGWPLSSDDWDAQMLFFLNHGYRVIAHDRRLRHALFADPAEIMHDLAAAGGMADMDGVLQVEMRSQCSEIVGVMIHVVAAGGL